MFVDLDSPDTELFIDDLGDFMAGEPIGSPFGAWLLLAATGRRGQEPVAEADRLLGCIPDGLKAAVAAWGDVHDVPDQTWLERGPIPTRTQADEWAHRNTDGLIPTFPGKIPSPEPNAFLLASAVLAKTAWIEPLSIRPSAQLAGEFSSHVEHCLFVPHDVHNIRLCEVGADVCVVVSNRGANGVTVHSVLGPQRWSAFTGQHVARVFARGRSYPASDDWARACFELDVATEPIRSMDGDKFEAYLPAWLAGTTGIDLSDAPGFAGLGDAAVQGAYARFDAIGFEAAAVTAVDRAGAPMREDDATRYTVRFNRPYAFAAGYRLDGPWRGMPLFEGWVTGDSLIEPEPYE